MGVSADGNRIYMAGLDGLIIGDTTDVQARRPNAQIREISRLTWPAMSIPQNAIPVTIGGRPFVVEIDEFSKDDGNSDCPAENGPNVGAGRIIDIGDEKRPRVISNLRLEVHQRENRAKVAGDPGASSSLQGYAGHYCSVPSPV